MADWLHLASKWDKHFPTGPKPSFVAQTPGRVNLIGEHVDHQAYPVCPCAIVQSMGACVSVEPKTDSNSHLEVAHVQEAYVSRTYKCASEVRVLAEKVWTNYIASAYFGVVEYYLNGEKPETVGRMIEPKEGLTPAQMEEAKKHPLSPLNFSIRILYDGNVPIAAGLSSSAALVCGTALALVNAHTSPPSMRALADLCAKAERYSGVASGGMDQAAVLLSKAGCANLIHFDPLTTEDVQLPEGGALVIVNSMVEIPKAQAAHKMYNKRVFELKVGCLALLPEEEAKAITADELLDLQLREVVRQRLKMTENELAATLADRLADKVWTKEDALKILGVERRDVLLKKRCGEDVWEKNEDFHVYNRVKHVLCEAQRVEDFAIIARDTNLSAEERLKRLGELMNGSGASMNHDFDASVPEVERLIALCREKGAYGARITGAGWGGCMVALVPESKKGAIIDAVKTEYFAKRDDPTISSAHRFPPQDQLDTVVFATVPSAGASVARL